MIKDIKKTIFGNYNKHSIDEYIATLNKNFEEQMLLYTKEFEALKTELESFEENEKAIDEAITHAKVVITQSREQAKIEAEAILANAHQECATVQETMLLDIDKLVLKYRDAERLYVSSVSNIKQSLESFVLNETTNSSSNINIINSQNKTSDSDSENEEDIEEEFNSEDQPLEQVS